MTMGWLQGEVEGKDRVKENLKKGLKQVKFTASFTYCGRSGNSMEIQC